MGLFRRAILLLLAVPALVGAGPPVPARCGYDRLTVDQREIALVLIAAAFDAQHGYAPPAVPDPIVARMVDDAAAACAGAGGWSDAQRRAAAATAQALLTGDVLRQALAFMGREAAPIDRFFAVHRDSLMGPSGAGQAVSAALAEHLNRAGWGAPDQLPLAAALLDALIAAARAEAAFAQAASQPPPSTTSSAR